MAFLWRSAGLQLYRSYVTAPASTDVRVQLTSAVKNAMKNKDIFASTTLRAVLAEVYAADKASKDEKVSSSAIFSILRKAATRRTESAAQFTAAARPDLADKELREADLLSGFLPPMLSEAEIDNHLSKILAQLPSGQKPGIIFKEFYTVVEKNTVDPVLVKNRLEILLKN